MDEKTLLNALDISDQPFSVAVRGPSKRRKQRGPQSQLVQQDLWQKRLSVAYEVTPSQLWNALRTYKRFTVGNESISNGECIFVRSVVTEDPDFNEFEQWKAKVLEIRACGSEHVFIRVAWLNRPEDLDDGRQEPRGERELIPTNKMDIINGMSVNGRCSVKYSNDPREWAALACDEYYWRQTWDSVTRKLSRLPRPIVKPWLVRPNATPKLHDAARQNERTVRGSKRLHRTSSMDSPGSTDLPRTYFDIAQANQDSPWSVFGTIGYSVLDQIGNVVDERQETV